MSTAYPGDVKTWKDGALKGGSPCLALLVRLEEAGHWDAAIRRHEHDPWTYLRRKLLDTEKPLRDYKRELFDAARSDLLSDLKKPFLAPGALEQHKENFEFLLPADAFGRLATHLQPGRDPKLRREGVLSTLTGMAPPTLFDIEALPPAQRGQAWEMHVREMARRLKLDLLGRVASRGEDTPWRRALLARRLRANLREYLAVTRSQEGLRDELTSFLLSRVEASIAASLRFLARWR